ncbi:MAG: ABC transporter substrate-binding protein [Treponema sp.]|nr:ABC transporter substrate-binding protein [Treponema sp.]
MKTTFNLVLLCQILLCIFLPGCKKAEKIDASQTSSFILGFSQIGAESAWRHCNTRSVRDAAAVAGVQLLYFNAEQKQENQIRALRSLIAYQVDVIAFVPIVTAGWERVLIEARDTGIPVLICDREINILDESLYAGYIGTNALQQGKSAAEYLLEKFGQEEYRKDRPIRIVELSGTEGSSVADKRAQGFRQVLAEHHAASNSPKFEIILSESGDFLRSKGYELMDSILDKYENIDVIYSHNDSMTLGVITAMKERGIKPGVDIIIVTIDAEQAAIDALERGEVNCVVECNPKQGPEILKLATLLANGETIPRITYMQEEVFKEGDDISSIPPRGY